MKILIVSNYFPPEIGAASNRIFQLARILRDFNHDIEVACPFPNYPSGKIIGSYKGIYKKEKVDGILSNLWGEVK